MYPISERVEGQARRWQWRWGGACRNTSECIMGGHGTCMRSWLGLGHVKGMWDVCGMVEVRQEGAGHVETHWDAVKGATVHG